MTTSKRVLILGATGKTGRHTVEQALSLGFRVTALARNPSRLGIEHVELATVGCDVTTQHDMLAAALRGQDVVISTLGRGLGLSSGSLIERSVTMLLPLMKQHGPRRLVFVSAFGVGVTLAEAPLPLRIVFRTLLRSIYKDKAIGEDLIQRSGLDWTIARAAHLTDGPATGRYEAGEHLSRTGVRHLTRADLAAFLLGCAADGSYSRQAVVVRS